MDDNDPLTTDLEFDVLTLITEGNLHPSIQHEIDSVGLIVTTNAVLNIMRELKATLDREYPDTPMNLDL